MNQRHEAARQERRADKEHAGDCDLTGHDQPTGANDWCAHEATDRRRPILRQRLGEIDPTGLPSGQKSARHARENRYCRREQQHAEIDRNGVQPGETGREQRRQQPLQAGGERQSCRSSAHPDDGVLDQELSDNAGPACADGGAYCDLPPPSRRARQLQAGHIRGRSDQQEATCC